MNTETHPVPFRLHLGLLAAACACAPLPAQDADGEQIFWLSPFEVVTEGDTGYARVSAGTATRIAMDIIDTPLSIQVISDEFIRDTGRTELVDIFDYSSSVDTSPDDALRNADIKVRGFGVSFVLRDGFKKYYDAPLDAIDRVEVVKGPNAVFFGQSQPGGVINYITKNPLWDPYYEARLEMGDHKHFKAWADATGPITDWMAYRLITSYRDSDSWKDYTSWENKYIFGALTVRPLRKLEVIGKYEYHDGFQEGGTNTALVGNTEYFNDYYANDGRDWGYAIDWANGPVKVNTAEATGMPTRYPWPVSPGSAAAGYIQPPDTGFGGINPRWDGTISQTLVDFFGGAVPQALLDWVQPAQDFAPAYQRGVTLPFQYRMIEYFAWGTGGANYEPGWRMMKWFASGMSEYPNRFTGPVFPKGYNWNANGKGAFHDTEHHIATLELKAEIFKWLNLRYAGNYLENKFLMVKQHNSDTDMDGFTLAPAQGYLVPSTVLPDGSVRFGGISGASLSKFDNKRYTHQLDLTADFELAGSRHTFLLSGEMRRDKFIEFGVIPTSYYVDNALRPLQLNRNTGLPRSYTFREGVANWDIFFDEPDNLLLWADVANARPGGSSSYHEQESVSLSWRGTFLQERLSVLAGFRWEETTNFGYALRTVGEGEAQRSEMAVGARTGDPLSETTPMVGANFRIRDGLAVYASYSESFVPPNRDGPKSVSFWEGPLDGAQLVAQDLDPLGPEKGIGYEAGLKASGFNGKVNGSLTAFHLEQQDIVVLDSNLVGLLRQNYEEYGKIWNPTLESGSTAPRKNSGTRVSEGMELDVLYRHSGNLSFNMSFTWLWKADLENPDAVDFYGDVNQPIGSNNGPYPHPSLFTDTVLATHTIASTGQVIEVLQPLSASELNAAISKAAASGADPVNPYTGEVLVFEPIQHEEMAQTSKVRFSLWTLYEFTEGRMEGLTVGGGGNYQSRQRPSQDRDFDYWNPGYWKFDAMLRYDIPFGNANNLSLQLNVNNVFDKRAIDSGGFGINAPRTWKVTATVKF
jgi:outer membrane receptor protein involved in Fe transport